MKSMRNKAHKSMLAAAIMAATTLLAAAPADAGVTPVAVTAAGRQGQAVLFQLNGKCIALTANHVVDGAAGATLTLEGNTTSRATVVEHADDIALMTIDDMPLTNCPDPVPQIDLQTTLDNASAAQIATIDKGERGRIVVSLTGNNATKTRIFCSRKFRMTAGWRKASAVRLSRSTALSSPS